MRNSIRLAAIGAVAAVSFASSAQAATTATATATAEILSTLAITNTAGLNFGTIAVNGAGTAVVGADGNNSCSTTLVCGGTRAPAAFRITGSDTVGVNAIVPTTATTLTYLGWTGAGAAPTMSLSSFTSYFPTGTTLVGGETNVLVGGSLAVGAAQVAGVYSGTFDVSVEYQ